MTKQGLFSNPYPAEILLDEERQYETEGRGEWGWALTARQDTEVRNRNEEAIKKECKRRT